MKRVKICLCGSTRFQDAFIAASKRETLKGKIVLSVGMFGHSEGLDMNGPIKKMLDELHLDKIDEADEVLFLNVGGYIGQSTRNELIHAVEQKKIIYVLELTNLQSMLVDGYSMCVCENCNRIIYINNEFDPVQRKTQYFSKCILCLPE